MSPTARSLPPVHRWTSPWPGRVGVGACAVLALLTAACGSSASSTTSSAATSSAAPSAGRAGTGAAAAAVRAAPAAVTSAGTGTVAVLVASNERVNGSGPLSVAVTEQADFRTLQGTGTMEVAGLPASSNPGALHLVFTEQGVYLETTGRFASLGGGKPWAEIQASSLGSLFADAAPKSGAGPLSSLAAICIGDPTAVLDLLDTTALSATRVGPASVAGVATTAYDVTIDPAAAERSASGPAASVFSGLGSSPVMLEVWLDHAGRLVQLQDRTKATTSSSSSAAAGGEITGVLVRLDDFGTPVTVTVPPASEVAVPTSSSAGASS
jgi:hypothetical protein